MRILTKCKMLALGLAAAVAVIAGGMPKAHAADGYVGLTMSPMNQMLILDPGDVYTGSFSIMNQQDNAVALNYDILIESFYRNDDNEAIFEDVNGMGQIADWITVDSPESGTLAPGELAKIYYTINVPMDAPAGGQYASIIASSSSNGDGAGNSVNLKESIAMAYTVMAEITGDTIHQGEIVEADVPSFLFDGNIAGSSRIKNTGNVHGVASYTLQVFPLFSGEEIYTNEENPQLKTIFPGQTLYNETTWSETPAIGIYNVVYTIEFEGVTKQVSKLVVKCPIWLLFVIAFAIVAIIIYFVVRAKNRKK